MDVADARDLAEGRTRTVSVARPAAGSRAARVARVVFFAAVFLYVVVPMVAVLLYSVASRWTAHILPDGYTLDWWTSTFGDSRIRGAFVTSFVLATLTAIADVALVVPAAYWSRVRNPRIRSLVEPAAAIPFSLPYLVIGFGLLQLSGIVVPSLQGTFALLLLGYVAIAFPFVYWAVDGALAAAGIERLSEAAETCGATPIQIIWRVVLPNVRAGVVSGGLLAFAAILGEFAMVQVLASGVNTIPVWAAESIRSYSGDPGAFNRLAVVTFVLFVLLFAISAAVVYWNRGQAVRILPGAGASRHREGP